MTNLMKIKENLARLGSAKLVAMGAVALLLLAGLAWIATQSRESMGLLYSGLDVAEAGRVGQKLQELKVPFQAKGDGTLILVPQSQVAQVRMELAAAGLPGQQGAGYELLDKQSPMNMTSFMQRVQWTRALEGELARTIVAMDGVRTARVHIVMPQRDTFSRETPKAAASVAVVMQGPLRLTPSQAGAIRLLVSGAVPGLQRDAVSVLDPSGVVVAANDGGGLIGGQLSELKANRERDLAKAVTNLLEPLVGRGKVRVVASVDIDDAREVTQDVKYDPQSQVERSKQIQTEQQQSDDTKPQPQVSVGQNLPNPQPQQPGADERTASTSTHNGQTINYEINTTRVDRVHEPGDTSRLTVAVVVDGVPDAKGVIQPRPKQQLDQLAELVRSAVGFNAKRGDVVSVDSLVFTPDDELGVAARAIAPAPAASWSLVTGIGVVIALLLAGAAAFALILRNNQVLRIVAAPEPQPALTMGQGIAAVTAREEEVKAMMAPALPPPEIGGLLSGLYELIDSRPEEVMVVLRAWISDNA